LGSGNRTVDASAGASRTPGVTSRRRRRPRASPRGGAGARECGSAREEARGPAGGRSSDESGGPPWRESQCGEGRPHSAAGLRFTAQRDRTAGLDSLKRFKEDAAEVREGFECGLKISGYDDVKVGDVIEAFRVEQVQRTL
jgi:hypothetical protein